MHERAWINMMKTIICKAQKDSMKDTPIWIDPVWQILHTNTRYKALPDCIKKRCIKAKFKDIVHRGETFATVEYRDTIYGEKGPFYIEKKSCKIIAKKYLRSDQTEKYRLATEQEIEDYRYYPVYYFNKFGDELYIVTKTYLVTAQNDYKSPENTYHVKAGQPFLLNEVDLYYWKISSKFKNDLTYHIATDEEIEKYEFPFEETGMKTDARSNKK